MSDKKVTSLQIAIEPDLKEKAEQMATKYGFNTVQDMVRFLLAGINDGRIIPGIDSTESMKALLAAIQQEKNDKTSKSDNLDNHGSPGQDLIISRRLRL